VQDGLYICGLTRHRFQVRQRTQLLQLPPHTKRLVSNLVQWQFTKELTAVIYVCQSVSTIKLISYSHRTISFPAVGRCTIYCPGLVEAAYVRIAFARTPHLSTVPLEYVVSKKP